MSQAPATVITTPLGPGPIPRFVIESTNAITELCELGQEANTDKSPFNSRGHRHPYTPVYSMLFAQYKKRPIQFAEIGIAMGASAEMWERYFDHSGTAFHFFDRDEQLLDHLKGRVQSGRVRTGLMDVAVDGDVARGLRESIGAGRDAVGLYDVIIDDSSHDLEHQIRIVKEALPLVKSGGLLIVEDVFRATPEEEYTKALAAELAQCSFAYFVVCEHVWKFSPGWDNDKLLVLVKA